MSLEVDNCPDCNFNFIGKPIPEEIRHLYGSATNWRNEVAISGFMLGIYDGTIAYKCPNCGALFPRDDSEWALGLFNEFLAIQRKGS